MEMSHRSKSFTSIAEKAKADLKKLLDIPDNYKIFFFQGGASLQFSAICFNLLGDEGKKANYVSTGTWSEGAIKEAKKYCTPTEVTNNKGIKYTDVADTAEWNIDEDATFFHFCDNETIQGIEFNPFPHDKIPANQITVCDMSSNFCSRPIDWSKFGVVYAGVQKNVGPAGCCITIVREDLIGKHRKDTPMLCDWETFGKAPNTFHNTPSCWPIYVSGLNIAYMLEKGLPAIQKEAELKSSMLYEYIDSSEGYYSNGVAKEFRSRMNVPFRVKANDELEAKFLAEATKANLIDLKGHRSVGGCRASIYNAMPVEGVQALIDFMKKFREENA